MKKSLLFLMFITATLIGCKKSETAPDSKPAVVVKVENNSPDNAVKSWWSLRDLIAEKTFERCRQAPSLDKTNEILKFVPELTEGVALKRLTEQDRDCVQTALTREIKSVNVESETRAIVIANIKEATPIPSGAVPDEHDLKRRAEGYMYKYLLEKNSHGWKIVQIYEQPIYSPSGDPWSPIFAEVKKVYIPSILYGPN